MTLLNNITFDLKEAAYRVAGTQILLFAKNRLLNALRKRGLDNKYITGISEFLDTDIGLTLLSTSVGIAIPFLPAFKKDKRLKNIAKEFRVGGLTYLIHLFTERTVGNVLPVIDNIIATLSQKKSHSKKIRIEIPKSNNIIDTTIENISVSELETNNIDYSKRKQITLYREAK